MHRTCTIKSSEQNKYFDVCLVLIFIRFIIIVVLEMFQDTSFVLSSNYSVLYENNFMSL